MEVVVDLAEMAVSAAHADSAATTASKRATSAASAPTLREPRAATTATVKVRWLSIFG